MEEDHVRVHRHIMTPDGAHTLLAAFCDELGRCGMRHAATCPGSRSAPLVMALAREPSLRAWSHLDERCAGFFALGVAKASGRPAAVACTSGTAAANLAPAVHEAREARVPMLVLTADRPPELREVGAGQVIDQIELYGTAAKWFFEVGTHEAGPAREAWMRALACRAYWTALEGRPGVVHLNFPLREPLVPEPARPAPAGGRPGGRPWVQRPPATGQPDGVALAQVQHLVDEHPRGVLVCGREERSPSLAAAVGGFAEASGYPVLADPLSGCRRPGAAVAHYDALLRDVGFAAAHSPDLVLRVGDLPTSKPLRAWLASIPQADQVGFAPDGTWPDPDSTLTLSTTADPATTLAELTGRLGRAPDASWLTAWQRADAAAAAAIADTLRDEMSEPSVVGELGRQLPSAATLIVASSMPVRDVETFFAARDDPPRVLANRGANGIDGTISTAFGVAACTDGPVAVLVGDVALAHDIGGLLSASRLNLPLTVVLLNNDGGGIFHFLPIAGQTDVFEEHVATPHGLDFARAAELYDCAHRRVTDLPGLRRALTEALSAGGTTILEVRTDRDANLELHRRVWEVVNRPENGPGGQRLA